jgi:hypothetical protein
MKATMRMVDWHSKTTEILVNDVVVGVGRVDSVTKLYNEIKDDEAKKKVLHDMFVDLNIDH